MIDPLQSLAFSVQANPGVYALLLGSGVSRSAGIPTGWEVVIDLLGKLAATIDEGPKRALEQWYTEEYGEPPDYSRLLNTLARTPSERQQLLRPYFEPDDQEREEGLKQPTASHKAIARLVAQGFVRVIVTTNFDRLIEKALEDEGITPTVLSTPEQVEGSIPLVHTDCCVIKVHGDYMDPLIRNTRSELEEYPPVIDQLLDRVLDEYGLVVCGWSAEWDLALRDAFFRRKSRRFSTYWAARGDLSDPARRLVDHRDAQVIPIQDADDFFQTVQQDVESIEEYTRPHPLSTEAAVASLKRYLPNQDHRIQLLDLVDAAVEQVIQNTSGEGFEMDAPDPDASTITERVRRYEAVCTSLLHMAAIGGFWANDQNSVAWKRAAERLATTPRLSGVHDPLWSYMRMYPAILLVYAFGLGALEAGNLNLIGRVFRGTVTSDEQTGDQSTVTVLNKLVSTFSDLGYFRGMLEGMQNSHLRINHWLHGALRQPLKPLIQDDDRYSYVFDRLEVLAALGYRSGWDADWFPLGIYMLRRQRWTRVVGEIEESIRTDDRSEYVVSGILGDTAEDCLQRIERFKNWVPVAARQMGFFYG